MKPFHFGVNVWRATSRAEWREKARKLEDLGYARATPEEGGRKIYEITPEGRAYLAEHRGTVDEIFERIAEFGAGFFSAEMREVQSAFGQAARATFRAAQHAPGDRERLKRVREILERAARELEELGRATSNE